MFQRTVGTDRVIDGDRMLRVAAGTLDVPVAHGEGFKFDQGRALGLGAVEAELHGRGQKGIPVSRMR